MATDPASAGREEARAFLQERMAFLGKAYSLIGLGFYLAGNLVAALLRGVSGLLTDLSAQVVLGAAAVYSAQWLICRRGRLGEAALRLMDGTSTVLVGALHGCMVFAMFPGELSGLSYARALLLVNFGLLMRAIIVPSSARRTFLLGLVAICFPVVASQGWYASQSGARIPPALQTVWTALWCLGGVVIASLASRVIYGLRQQVREAWQLGQYTLLEKIGEGGMGAVYRASHAMLRRPTAVKLLRPEQSGAEHLQRFEREVQLTSSLTHPNTVAIFDYGRTPDGVFYYAMEYLEGVNLEDLVRLDGPQPPGRVTHILRQVAGSLAEAHGVGLIHRDIKPGNVILVPERGGMPDLVKVVDFGLVKHLSQETGVTGDRGFAGTPLYLSPEAITSPGAVDARSDLYSLGCLGYYLLTGRPVFEGATVIEVFSHHLHASPVSPSERLGRPLPPGLSALVLSCLEKQPDRRPPSARAVITALEAGDAPLWTDGEARLWWSTRGGEVLALRRSRGATATVVGERSFVRRQTPAHGKADRRPQLKPPRAAP